MARGFYRDWNRGVLQNIRNPEILDDVELLTTKVYLKSMKAIKNYLILCLLLVLPLQSIAATFQLVCQNTHKTSVANEKNMSHCHQTQAKAIEHKQSKEAQGHNTSNHCLSFCAQASMAALIQDTVMLSSQNNDIFFKQYIHHYDSVIPPSIQRPPISFS